MPSLLRRFFNTFDDIYEPNTGYKHAPTLRSFFSEKMNRAFLVLLGSPMKNKDGNPTPYTGLGLIDIPLLGLPALAINLSTSNFLTLKNLIKDKRLGAAIAFGSFIVLPANIIIAMPVLVARSLVALALALVCLPIVGIVHLISKGLSKKYREAISNIPLDSKNAGTLGSFLGKDPNLSNVAVNIAEGSTAKNLTLQFRDYNAIKRNEIALKQHNMQPDIVSHEYNRQVTLDVSKPANGEKSLNRMAFKALLKLHVGGQKSATLYTDWRNIEPKKIKLGK